jgi:hypothetical protein
MADDHSKYAEEGYYIEPDPVTPTHILARAQSGMEAVRDGIFDTTKGSTDHPGYDPTRLCKINNCHPSDPGLYGLVTCSELGSRVAQITGSRFIQVWASQLLIKPHGSQDAGQVGWHQDRQYWQYWKQAEGLFTVWIALSDVGVSSGPMQFVTGSHAWGFKNSGDFFSHEQDSLRAAIPIPDNESWHEKPALLSAGGFSVHHCLTYHGSGANVSDAPRCSLAVHVRDERSQPVEGDTSYYTTHLDDPQICPMMYES